MSTTDGNVWTPDGGLKTGLPCIGVIKPSQNTISNNTVFDVIVLGAGYAGLVAARDLSTQGRKVLLLEGRDRIGGRTWHATLDGFNYEMGGTWIHWHMPHIYREFSLYGMEDQWTSTHTDTGKEAYCTFNVNGKRRNATPAEEASLNQKIWSIFCDIDGTGLRKTIPYALGYKAHREAIAKWDNVSCKDRLDQVKDQLTTEEYGVLEAVLFQMGGGPLENMAFTEAMRWYSLGGYIPDGLNDIGLNTRPKLGQSALARKIFEHALSSGNLTYAFNTPIASVVEEDGLVAVSSRFGASFKASQVICTIPLNVMSSIKFTPPLSPYKTDAFKIGHINRGNKIHADIAGPDLVSWRTFATPGKGMICAIADNLTPGGDTHLVLFGPTPDLQNGINLADGVDGIRASVQHLLPESYQKITRIVYHDWYADEFAKGTWCFYPPKMASEYLEALREPHGRVHFASADWSHGWRGWIDGAVEQGASSAMVVQKILSSGSSSFTANL